MTQTPELLPCPFCGGEAEQRNPEQPHGGMVNCRRCGAEAFGPKWQARLSHAIHEPASVMREEAAKDAETLDQFADRIVGKVRRALLDRLDDDVIGDLRDSHLIFARHCVKDAVWTAMREMGSALANLPLSDGVG